MLSMFRRVALMPALLVCATSVAASVEDESNPALPQEWTNALQWRSIGPANMSGRITSLTVSGDDYNTWWAATASGGLLKTTNDGLTFEHQFQYESTIAIGDVAVAPSDSKIVWVGTGEANPRNSVSFGDGVYKSTDGGATWKNMGLKDSFQIGRILIHPENPDVVYVGALGRLWGSNEERGLYKTTDGGETWVQVLNIDDKTGVIDAHFHPENPDTMLVATYERARDGFDTNDPAKRFGPGTGLYKTTDGGESFRKITEGLPTGLLGRMSIDYYDANPDIVYLLVESERIGNEPEDAPFVGASFDNAEVGARLTEVAEEGPATTAGLKAGDIVIAIEDENVFSAADFTRVLRSHVAGKTVQMTISRDRKPMKIEITLDRKPTEEEGAENPGSQNQFSRPGPFGTRLGGQQANYQDHQGDDGFEFGGVYRSEDGGESWERINSLNPRPMYFSHLRVDPKDNNNIYICGIALHKSHDGGATFSSNGHSGRNGSTHVDHHAIWIDDRDPRHIILGNDGGVYVTRDRMITWDHLNHVAIGQFYHVGVGPRRDYMVYGGLQDNGSWGGPSVKRGSGMVNEDWFRIGGGDGFICLVDPTDPDQLYFESQNGGMRWTNLRTGAGGSARPRPPRGESYRFNWRTPFMLSNHNPKIFLAAGNHVFRSLDRGSAMQAISPVITNTDRGSATALSESPLDSDVIYVGTDDGAIWMTQDGGDTWTDLFNKATATTDAPASEAGSEGEDTPAATEAPAASDASATESAPATDVVSGRWNASAYGDNIPEGEGTFVLNLKLSGSKTVTGQLKADIGNGDISNGTYDAATGAVSFNFDTGQMVLSFKATIKDGAMSGTMDIEGMDFSVEFKAKKAGGGPAFENHDDAISLAMLQEVAAILDDISGSWSGNVIDEMIPPGEGTFSIELKLDDEGKITGTLSSDMGDSKITAGSYDADSQKITFTAESEMASLKFSGKVNDGSMSGSVDLVGMDMTFEFKAKREAGATEGAAERGPRRGGPEGQRVRGEGRGSRRGASRRQSSDDEEAAGPSIAELLPKPMYVSTLEASRFARERVYLSIDGHRSNDDTPYIFVSEDYGQSWESLRSDLPASAGPVRCLAEDITNPDILYIGCEFSIWVSVNRGQSWTRLNSNLPHCAVHAIAQHPTSGEIVAGTHGRSLWVLDVTALRQWSASSSSERVELYDPATVVYWDRGVSRGSTLRRFVGQNPSSNATIYYALGESVGSVSIEIRDIGGETLVELEGGTSPGLHSVTWNMRKQAPTQNARRRRFMPRVPPGQYQVIMKVGNQTMTTVLSAENDPSSERENFGFVFDEWLESIGEADEFLKPEAIEQIDD